MTTRSILLGTAAASLLTVPAFAQSDSAMQSDDMMTSRMSTEAQQSDTDGSVFTPDEEPSPDQPITDPAQTADYATDDMAAVLTKLTELGAKPIDTLTPEEARSQPSPADAVRGVLEDEGESTEPMAVASTRDIEVPGADGSLNARIYRPEGSQDGEALPVIAYWHGGGWVIADIDTYDATPRSLANGANAMVVSFDYRQAPENTFPAAHEDAWAAYEWLTQNAASLGGDPERIALVGESAGGNLAANVAMRARDEGGTQPIYEVLVYPVAGSDTDTPSYVENQSAMPLSKAAMEWFFGYYTPDEADHSDPRIDLVNADVSGLPPTTVITAELDPLRSEGRTLAANLDLAGVETRAQTYPGVTHEFFGMAAAVEQAQAAQDYALEGLRDAFEGNGAALAEGDDAAAEGEATARAEFAALDEDENGTLERKEFVDGVRDMQDVSKKDARKLFKTVAQGDDEVTEDEFVGAYAQIRGASRPSGD
ncbi:alpha/beta hydrolase fold domain-containing protein [Parvularcula dongshanensis]|uniref:Acetyl esterase/lipase n=1 Tax=Parvularcula dongshanensis TaxID=1173995 RepID=A0A840I1D2_9PROT|nr:alpha/beta hydrolase fold domain-containing protein [Parvularcula dongshanensis]MBB4658629.1 acetyl esterase/lipase [Parvularcula dongshanensis]